jgi:predicted CXXCH cytochrome family protein
MFRKLAGLTAIAGLFIAGSASAAISGSAHDLRLDIFGSDASGNVQGEICVVCHAPHDNANTAGTLLWNRAATTTTFVMYDSPTLNSAINDVPGATSLLCLGCHDGSIAVDSYGGPNGNASGGTTAIDGSNFGGLAAFDAAMGNDHPIGIVYAVGTGSGQDPELNATTTTVTFGSGTGTIGSMLQAGAVECATCHDVHNTASDGNNTLLLVDNAGSALCTTCHIK